jgi:REP element-mobilizing transposase RayT
MAENISKSHNVSVLLYHLVCPSKYRRKIFSEEVRKSLLLICFEITQKHEIEFLEIGTDADHVHFLIQGIPRMSPSEIVRVVKSKQGGRFFVFIQRLKQCYGVVTSGQVGSTSIRLVSMGLKK